VDLVVDFDENYNFEIQNEMQNMHWHNYQISILVHICWMQKLNLYLHDLNSCILMKYHFYILDEKSHDNYFVQHCFGKIWWTMDFAQNNIGIGQTWVFFTVQELNTMTFCKSLSSYH
jgi:hypothetical protein